MFSGSRKILLWQLILMLTLGLSGCSSLFGTKATPTPSGPTPTPEPPTATPEPMAATVNGEGITIEEFQAELVRYKSAQQALARTVTDEDASKTVLEDLIAQVLLAQGAHAAGYKISDSALQSHIDALTAQVGGADALLKWQANRGYTDQSFRRTLKRSVEAAWMRDKIVSAVPHTAEQVHVQQILLYNQDTANQVLAQLNDGADFGELAAKYDPTTHGELGWFPKGYLLDAKIEEAAFALQPGEHSDVIATDVGFHIIKVLERDAQRPLSPDAYLTMQELALQDWLHQQRDQSTIVLAP